MVTKLSRWQWHNDKFALGHAPKCNLSGSQQIDFARRELVHGNQEVQEAAPPGPWPTRWSCSSGRLNGCYKEVYGRRNLLKPLQGGPEKHGFLF